MVGAQPRGRPRLARGRGRGRPQDHGGRPVPGLTRRVPGLVVTEHEFSVPLDHSRDDGRRITVFAREVADPEGLDRPLLVYFQGGPGQEAPRPLGVPPGPGWLPHALRDFRVLLLDQRGTGRSTPVGVLSGMAPSEQADYLALFRADSIVRDAEFVRRELGVERWSVLGQSFGGFCVLCYLSLAPSGLREAMITGGLPALGARIDEAYRLTFAAVASRAAEYFERYLEDRSRFERLLGMEGLRLPSGDVVTPRRVRQLGQLLGMKEGFEQLHYLLELDPSSLAFGHDFDRLSGFVRNPTYAVLHEACWADGGATRWAAARVMPSDAELTGEHVFPWMFEEFSGLAGFRSAAELLAEREWPRLYDAAVLGRNEVPVAAVVYARDMYVPRALSEETAAAVRGLRVWLTDEFEHNGLRTDGERVLGRLLDLVRGRA